MARTLRKLSVFSLLLAVVIPAHPQTLAHPGWTASGFNADPWWKHAVFYEVKPSTGAIAYMAGDEPPSVMDWLKDPQAISKKLDGLQALGVDALIVPMQDQQPMQTTQDNWDELVRQASLRGIHILLRVSAVEASSDLTATARLWLSRGVSGFYVATSQQGGSMNNQTIVPMLRRMTSASIGGRIVIADLSAESGAGLSHRGHYGSAPVSSAHGLDASAPQLQVDARESLPGMPDAASLRRVLEDEPQDANLLVDLQPPPDSSNSAELYASLWKTIATISLTTHPIALIDADTQLSESSDATTTTLADWYRQLIALHRGNSTLRYGSATPLNFDTQNALVWVSRASAGTGLAAPVVVACNLSSSPIHVSLGLAMRDLNLHGSFLRTLLRTDSGMGPQDLNSVAIPAYGVYIGELHR